MSNTRNLVDISSLVSGSSTALSIPSVNLTFGGTAQRITGDFSSATVANRLAFQSSTTNGNTIVYALPNGTATTGSFITVNASDPTNGSYCQIRATSAETGLYSSKYGTGTYLPMTFYTGDVERIRIDTTGRVGIGTTPSVAGVQLTVLGGGTQLSPGTTAQEGVRIQRATGYATLSGINNDNNAYNGLQFFTGASAAVTIDTSGNVGIGTASPSKLLQVANNSNSVEALFSSTANVYAYLTLNTWALDRAQIRAEVANPGAGSGTGSGILSFWTARNPTMTEAMRIDGSGNLGIGTSSPNAYSKITIGGTWPTSANISYGTVANGIIPSGATGAAVGYYTGMSTQASAFTCGAMYHYFAAQGTIGASSVISNQYGFFVDSGLVGATNNYGFYSNIPSGSNRWNFYAAGTAPNVFIGNVQLSSSASQYSSSIASRNPGNQYEWGHSNTAGYGCVIGAEVNSGAPFIGFHTGAGTNANTYRTYGILGTVIKSDNAGGLGIYRITTATGDNQSVVGPTVFFNSSGGITSANLADAVGYKGTPLNEQSAAYTLVIEDMGKSIVHPASDNNARTFTIPANGTVAFPVGTTITFINMVNTVTIAITTDTMYLAGAGTTGSRTLAAYGMATAVKMTSTTWIISGNGLT